MSNDSFQKFVYELKEAIKPVANYQWMNKAKNGDNITVTIKTGITCPKCHVFYDNKKEVCNCYIEVP